jgi:hypothetical protein
MKLLRFFIISSLFILPLFSFAQQKEISINVAVYRQNTSERVAQALVTDLKSQVIMMSDELGGFTIKTAVGDTLLFNKTGYAPLKQVVTGPADIVVYMQPVVVLQGVTVKAENSKKELNDVINTYRSKGLYFDGKPPLSLFSPFGGSPITGFYELFSRDATNERRFIKFSKEESEAIAVDSRYTKSLVKRVTNLSDDEVIKFMQQYRPSYEDLKEWNDYELISHIKKYLVYYKQHPNGAFNDNLN